MNKPNPSLMALDSALRTVFAPAQAARPCPADAATAHAPLSEPEKRLSAALMRVNHVGEVCAQALYSAQAVFSKNPSTRTVMQQAAKEETDHLAWTEQRIKALGSHTSYLNPLWYAGAFAIGAVAARLGDGFNLGFVAETERQVGRHLQSHLSRLPAQDTASRAIVSQMQADEAEHAQMAVAAGGKPLPAFVPPLMQAASKVMTTVAHHI